MVPILYLLDTNVILCYNDLITSNRLQDMKRGVSIFEVLY